MEEQVEGLLKARAEARKAKDFAKADAIRDELTSLELDSEKETLVKW